MASNDPMVQELEHAARTGFRKSGRGCLFVKHSLDGTSEIFYASLRTLQSDPLPGISDDPDLMKALGLYDTEREYLAVEFIEETNGTTKPTWYHLLYTSAETVASA